MLRERYQMEYEPELLRGILAHAVRCYPVEGCGLVFAGPRGARALPVENALDRYHARDPVRFPRTARTGYLMDPLRQLEAFEAAEAAGEKLVAVFHSHADVGAYFSEEDRAQALGANATPLFPGVEYLVLSVRAAGCDAILGFRFAGEGRWLERTIALPPG